MGEDREPGMPAEDLAELRRSVGRFAESAAEMTGAALRLQMLMLEDAQRLLEELGRMAEMARDGKAEDGGAGRPDRETTG